MNDSFKARCQNAACRCCSHVGLEPILDLGSLPPSDRLLSKNQLQQKEDRFPLELAICPKCALVQITEVVPADFLFGEAYLYFSSFSQALLEHSRKNALELIERKQLGPENLVVELASNDGYLLKNFVEKGIPVQGIDPAPQQAKAAESIGVPTINDFFGQELAKSLKKDGRQADLIIANNVVAHVSDTHDFVEGIAILLKEDGLVSVEFPSVKELIDHLEFDTIYHEHLCYFSLISADALFRAHGLYINDVVNLPIHGGSFRLYISKHDKPSERLEAQLAEERRLGLDSIQYYQSFAQKVEDNKATLLQLLQGLKAQGKRIAAYGAAAKGSIMLNYCGLDDSTIEYIVDRNIHKHGKYMSGSHIEILPTETLLEDQPDYVLILPWNFKDEIISQQQEYVARGGRFIVPIPSPVIL